MSWTTPPASCPISSTRSWWSSSDSSRFTPVMSAAAPRIRIGLPSRDSEVRPSARAQIQLPSEARSRYSIVIVPDVRASSTFSSTSARSCGWTRARSDAIDSSSGLPVILCSAPDRTSRSSCGYHAQTSTPPAAIAASRRARWDSSSRFAAFSSAVRCSTVRDTRSSQARSPYTAAPTRRTNDSSISRKAQTRSARPASQPSRGAAESRQGPSGTSTSTTTGARAGSIDRPQTWVPAAVETSSSMSDASRPSPAAFTRASTSTTTSAASGRPSASSPPVRKKITPTAP